MMMMKYFSLSRLIFIGFFFLGFEIIVSYVKTKICGGFRHMYVSVKTLVVIVSHKGVDV